MMLTPHFSQEEFCFSARAKREGIDNTLPNMYKVNALRVCSSCEIIREQYNQPLIITSGYRCEKLNGLEGGSKSSKHMEALAVDHHFKKVPLLQHYQWILNSKIPFDQLILEFGSWVHLGLADLSDEPRHEALMIFSKEEGYLPFDLALATERLK